MVDGIVELKKLTDSCSDEQFLKSVYSVILQRDIDSIASENYLKALQGGYLREQVVTDLLNTPEFVDGSVSWLCGSKASEFFKENKIFWAKQAHRLSELTSDSPCLFVSFCHPDPTFLVRNGIIAKYLQLQRQCRIIPVALTNRYQTMCQQLADSFGFDDCVLIDGTLPNEVLPDNEFQELPRSAEALRPWLLNLNFDGIVVGDLIYDSYLRDRRVGTIEKSDEFLKRYCQLARRFYDTYRRLFDQYGRRVIATIQDHIVYINGGILSRLALSRDIPVYSNHGRSSPLILKKIDTPAQATNFELKFSPTSFRFVLDRLGKNEIEAGLRIVSDYYLKGENHQHTLLESDKYRLYKREGLLQQLRMDSSKPVVFIMSHLMCDAPHQQGRMLFDDYYQWLYQTLKIVKNVPEVNWIVKEHPFDVRYTDRYTTQEAIELFQQYSHVRACPVDLHPGSLIDAADALVTARGTAGLEAAVFGKPCVIAGESPYSGHGIAIEPQTIEEYRKALQNLRHPKLLSAETIFSAKAYAYLFFQLSRVNCAFLPPVSYVSLENMPDGEQWYYMTERLKTLTVEDDPLYRNLLIQSDLDFPHLLNFESLFENNRN